MDWDDEYDDEEDQEEYTGEDDPPSEPSPESDFFWLQNWDDPFLHRAFPLPQGPGFDQVHTDDDDDEDEEEEEDKDEDGSVDSNGCRNDDEYPPIVEEEYEFPLDQIIGDDGFELDRCEICNRLWIDCYGCRSEPQVDPRESSSFREHARQVRRRQRRANETEAEREERVHVRNQRRLNPPAPRDREFWEETTDEDTSEEEEGEEGEQVEHPEETEEGQINCDPHSSGIL